MKFKCEQFLGANFGYLRHSLDYFINSMLIRDIHNIEFYAFAPHLCMGDCTSAEVQSVKKRFKQADIRVKCFTPEHGNYPISLSTSDNATRKRSFKYYESGIQNASELEAPFMQIISGYGLIDDQPEENYKRAVDGLSHIADIASKYGVTIILEADPNCVIKNTNDQIQAIREVSSPYLSGMIDTNAIALNGEDLSESVNLLGDDLKHVHFIDLDIPHNRYCLVPGEGVLPMSDYFDIFANHHYSYGITPEFWGNTYYDDADGSLDRAFRFFNTNNQ